jgi:cell shape-determining protein MreD
VKKMSSEFQRCLTINLCTYLIQTHTFLKEQMFSFNLQRYWDSFWQNLICIPGKQNSK